MTHMQYDLISSHSYYTTFKKSNWNPDWFSALMNLFGTNYIPNDNKNLSQNDQNAIPSKMPYYSYPAILMNQNEIPIEFTH